MVKQTGLVKYSGTLGGVRHFKIKGLEAEFAGGPTAEQINTDYAFVRTRENMSELGGCAKVGKTMSLGLSTLMKQMSDPQVTGRLTTLMKEINLNDTAGVRGERGISFHKIVVMWRALTSIRILALQAYSMLRCSHLSHLPEIV